MSERLSIAELRSYLGPNPGRFYYNLPGAQVLALVEAVEAAHLFLDLDFGYLPLPTQRALVPLLDALASFDFAPSAVIP